MNTDPVPSSPASLPYQIVALVVLVILAAFFAAAEAALVSISRLRARAIAERKVRGSQNLVPLVDDKNRYLTSILVGNTVVLLAGSSLATYAAIELGLPRAALLSTIVMTVVFLLFGEIIPKTIATGDSERWALRLALPTFYVSFVLAPIARTFQVVTDMLLRLFRIKHGQHSYVTEEDIRALVNVGAEQRVIEEQERELIHSVMEFGDTIVREVMKPRPTMVAVAIDDSARRVLDVVIAEGYSKLPVYQESKDDIVGVIHDRELLIALANGSLAHTSVRLLMRPAVHVPETKKIADLLREMQRDKFSLAIVVDEYGGTAGLVTMEDLLEEIVGEIRDEHDADEQEPISLISDTEAVVEAGVNVEDVNARLGTELPTEDFETIGGYTVGLFGRLPNEGEEVDANEHTRLRVDRKHGRRILTVRIYTNGSIQRPQESEDSDAAARL